MSKLRSSGRAAFIVGLMLLLLPWAAIALLARVTTSASFEIPTTAIEPNDGKGYITPIRPGKRLGFVRGVLFEFPDDHAGGNQSGLRLFENEQELGPAHCSHRDVREFGDGRFSHWERNLYFSSSDGGDARDGARRYRVETPIRVSRTAGFIALGLSIAGAIIMWLSPLARRRTEAWRARWLHTTAPLRTVLAPLPTAWRAALVTLWIACAATSVLIGRGEHDPYLLSTVPTAGFGDHTNALPGYAVFLDGVPRHQENMQTWDHVAMFNGARIAADMFSNRPLYPFLVSCLAWIVGVGGACLLVNLAAWATGVWTATRIGAEASGRWEGGVVAGALACLGPGWWFHAGDFSAHQLSFATSAMALLILLRSRVWAARQPAEVHAAIAGVLVIASLAYNSGLFFTAAYVLLALWRNRWWHVLIVALVALAVQRGWTPLLNLLSRGSFDYYAVERQLFNDSLQTWRVWLSDGTWPYRAWDVFIDTLVSYAAVLPLLVLGALAPLLRGVRADARSPEGGAMLLLLLTVAMPIVATIIYSPEATARGYLVFGASTAVWAVAAVVLARLRSGAWRGAAIGLLLLGLTAQVIMVTRHADGDARGVKLYMWGQRTWNRTTLDELRKAQPTVTLGLAGEGSPRIGGGEQSMVEVGGFDGGAPFVTMPAFRNGLQLGQMLVVRGVLLCVFVIAIHLLWRSGLIAPLWRGRHRGSLALAASLGVLLVPPVAARMREGGAQIRRHDLHARDLPRRAGVVTFEVEVDPQRLLLLEQWAARAAGVWDEMDAPASGAADQEPERFAADVLTGFGWSKKDGDGVEVEIFAGTTPLTRFDTEGVGRHRTPVDLAALVAGLRNDPRLRVVARRDGGIISFASWQRGDLSGRVLSLDDAPLIDAAIPAPILEIRIVPVGREYDPRVLLF